MPELNSLRAYTDEEVRALLGGISRMTLWKIRDQRKLISSGYLYAGSRVRRTTATQLQHYLDYLATADATANPADADIDLDRIDELSPRRTRSRRLA